MSNFIGRANELVQDGDYVICRDTISVPITDKNTLGIYYKDKDGFTVYSKLVQIKDTIDFEVTGYYFNNIYYDKDKTVICRQEKHPNLSILRTNDKIFTIEKKETFACTTLIFNSETFKVPIEMEITNDNLNTFLKIYRRPDMFSKYPPLLNRFFLPFDF